MSAKRRGHVINISSIGVLTNAPSFSAYVASKAALDAWTACAASEFADVGIKFTTINMPLVRTPMIAPTKLYQNVPTLSPEEAGDLIVRAIVDKPVRIATRLGIFGAVLHALAPRVAQIMMNTTFRMFPDSDAAKGAKEGEKPKATARSDRICEPDAGNTFLGVARVRMSRRCRDLHVHSLRLVSGPLFGAAGRAARD